MIYAPVNLTNSPINTSRHLWAARSSHLPVLPTGACPPPRSVRPSPPAPVAAPSTRMSLSRLLKPPGVHTRRTRRRTLVLVCYALALVGAFYYLLNTFGWRSGSAPAPARPYPNNDAHAAAQATPRRNRRPTPRPVPPQPVQHRSAFPQHEFRRDGLLGVNPEGRHPIFDLVERAEREWERKLSKASKSLDEAVAEYRRRYGRKPPKGFDQWCVPLPLRLFASFLAGGGVYLPKVKRARALCGHGLSR